MIPVRWVKSALGLTALLNVVGGLLVVSQPTLAARWLYGLDGPMEPLLLRHHLLLWLFVVAMGAGYSAAARDPGRHTALILAGGLGKLCAVAVWIEMLASGLARWPLAVGAAFDGPLGVLLLVWWGTHRRRPSSAAQAS